MNKIFDLHCDAIFKLYTARENNLVKSLTKSDLQIDEEKLVKGNYFAQCFAVYTPNKFPNSYKRCVNAINLYYEELKKCSKLSPVYKFSDFENNAKNNKISAVLTMEDGCPIGQDITRLNEFYDLGVRMICLTHNLINSIGHPNYGKYFEDGTPDKSIPNTKQGLTDFGITLVKKMNELGIVIDVSHLSDKGFYDVIKLSSKPIIASHSNSRSVCYNVRNLTDDMLFELAKNGGVTGINFAKEFLNEKNGDKTVSYAINHIKYIKNKIGIDHIALGSDFDGIDPNIELKDASKMHLLVNALEKEGFSSEEIDKITSKNALRVFKECVK